MEDLLDFDDAAAYPFGLSNNSACAATSVSCLENNHSVQSTVKASASRSFTPPASNSPPCSSPGCNALWDWITKSQMQLVVLSEAMVLAICWNTPLCPRALVTGKLEFHQIYCAKDVYKKPKSWWTIHFVTLMALNKSSPEDF